MAIFGSLSTVRAQLARPEHFAAAFAYAEECLRSGSPAHARLMAVVAGKAERVELSGGLFASLQTYQTKQRSEGKWESHRAYIDVQVVVAGEECIDVADIRHLKVSEDLIEKHDAFLYHPFDQASALRLNAGDIAVLFPVDGHLPGLALSAPVSVRKVVVKVPVPA